MSKRHFLKEISKTELNGCVEVIRASFETVELPLENYSAIDTRRLIFESDNGNIMFGLFEEEKQIGFVQLDKRENDAVLKKLCVIPRYRGESNGESLVNHTLDAARRLGYKTVTANIRAEDKWLEEWFVKRGFGIVETRYLPPYYCEVTKLSFEL